MSGKRHPTHVGDRGEYRRTPPKGIEALPEYVCDDVTGKYEGEELAAQRSRRPTDTRIARLEDKHDSLVAVVSEMGQALGRVEGKLDVLPQLVDAVKDASDRVQEREHLRVVTDIQVDGAQKMAAVETGAVASRSRWQLVTEAAKVIGAIAGAGGAMELIHWLIGRFS